MGQETAQLSQAQVDELSARLSGSADLRLPGNMTKSGSEAPTLEKKKEYLTALLLRDPGVFLERYGELLTPQERAAFEPLRGDYEVDFYLKLLEDAKDTHKHDTAVKNRRLAYMNRLLQEGVFFSDEAMKERQPYLHHQYIGQYTPPGEAGPSVPSASGAGAPAAACALAPPQDGQAGGAAGDGGDRGAPPRWQGMALSRSLLRHQDELEAMLARRAEQERYDMVEEETDSDEEEGERAAAAAAWDQQGGREEAGGGRGRQGGENEQEEEELGYVPIPEGERGENAAVFLDLMKERFLRGEEAGVDYRAIDNDTALDEDWADQAGRDAEDKYFDED